jgi:hypothetical protein
MGKCCARRDCAVESRESSSGCWWVQLLGETKAELIHKQSSEYKKEY